jgi:hypothetical protein
MILALLLVLARPLTLRVGSLSLRLRLRAKPAPPINLSERIAQQTQAYQQRISAEGIVPGLPASSKSVAWGSPVDQPLVIALYRLRTFYTYRLNAFEKGLAWLFVVWVGAGLWDWRRWLGRQGRDLLPEEEQ